MRWHYFRDKKPDNTSNTSKLNKQKVTKPMAYSDTYETKSQYEVTERG